MLAPIMQMFTSKPSEGKGADANKQPATPPLPPPLGAMEPQHWLMHLLGGLPYEPPLPAAATVSAPPPADGNHSHAAGAPLPASSSSSSSSSAEEELSLVQPPLRVPLLPSYSNRFAQEALLVDHEAEALAAAERLLQHFRLRRAAHDEARRATAAVAEAASAGGGKEQAAANGDGEAAGGRVSESGRVKIKIKGGAGEGGEGGEGKAKRALPTLPAPPGLETYEEGTDEEVVRARTWLRLPFPFWGVWRCRGTMRDGGEWEVAPNALVLACVDWLQAVAEVQDLLNGRALLSELCVVRARKGGVGESCAPPSSPPAPLPCAAPSSLPTATLIRIASRRIARRARGVRCCGAGFQMGFCSAELQALLRLVHSVDLRAVAARLDAHLYQATGALKVTLTNARVAGCTAKRQVARCLGLTRRRRVCVCVRAPSCRAPGAGADERPAQRVRRVARRGREGQPLGHGEGLAGERPAARSPTGPLALPFLSVPAKGTPCKRLDPGRLRPCPPCAPATPCPNLRLPGRRTERRAALYWSPRLDPLCLLRVTLSFRCWQVLPLGFEYGGANLATEVEKRLNNLLPTFRKLYHGPLPPPHHAARGRRALDSKPHASSAPAAAVKTEENASGAPASADAVVKSEGGSAAPAAPESGGKAGDGGDDDPKALRSPLRPFSPFADGCRMCWRITPLVVPPPPAAAPAAGAAGKAGGGAPGQTGLMSAQAKAAAARAAAAAAAATVPTFEQLQQMIQGTAPPPRSSGAAAADESIKQLLQTQGLPPCMLTCSLCLDQYHAFCAEPPALASLHPPGERAAWLCPACRPDAAAPAPPPPQKPPRAAKAEGDAAAAAAHAPSEAELLLHALLHPEGSQAPAAWPLPPTDRLMEGPLDTALRLLRVAHLLSHHEILLPSSPPPSAASAPAPRAAGVAPPEAAATGRLVSCGAQHAHPPSGGQGWGAWLPRRGGGGDEVGAAPCGCAGWTPRARLALLSALVEAAGETKLARDELDRLAEGRDRVRRELANLRVRVSGLRGGRGVLSRCGKAPGAAGAGQLEGAGGWSAGHCFAHWAAKGKG